MKHLLSPVSIGNCTLQNRIVLTAASLCRSPNGMVTPELIDFYAARAKGGVGLLMVGAAGVDPIRRSHGTILQACEDSYIPELQKITHAVHKEGGKLFLQLYHPGAYADPTMHKQTAIAPSSYYCKFTRQQTLAMTKDEIHQIISFFAAAAKRSQTAGFDGVELCGSVGYLIAEFLSAATNHRTDEYGGSLSNRMRFLLEIVHAVKEATGAAFPLSVRLSGEDYIPKGNTIEDTVQIACALEQAGVDALNITGGWHESHIPQITGHVPRGGYLHLAHRVKEAVSIPVIGCNRLDWESGQRAVFQGDCDLVGLCRPLIADPDLVKKAAKCQTNEIRRCLSCNQECLDRVFANQPVRCAVNPFIGTEQNRPSLREIGKKILVIGAGISGMTYAALAAAGNHVTIAEQSGTYGGTANLLKKLPALEDSGTYIDGLYQQCLRQKVTFQFYTSYSPAQIEALLKERKFDRVVIAAGAATSSPNIPILSGKVYSALDCMELDLPGKVVFIGNDFRTYELALGFAKKRMSHRIESEQFFAKWTGIPKLEQNIESGTVTCIGPLKKSGNGMAKSIQWAALLEGKHLGVQQIPNAKITSVMEKGVHYIQEDAEYFLPADAVFLSTGWMPNPSFAPEQFPPEIREQLLWIGDSKTPGRISSAVRTAAKAALSESTIY